MEDQIYKKVQNFIAKGKLEEAIKYLRRASEIVNKDTERTLILLASKLERFKQKQAKGTISQGDYEVEYTKIGDAVLELIGRENMKRKASSIGQSFLVEFGDFFLDSEESSRDWLDDKKLKSAFYYFAMTILLFLPIAGFNQYLIHKHGSSFAEVILCRSLVLALYILISIALMHLTLRYFKFTVIENRRIYFINAFVFYLFSLYLFGNIYHALYYLDSSNFICRPDVRNILSIPTDGFVERGQIIQKIKLLLNFVSYSISQSLGADHFGIRTNHLWVNVVNWAQSIYTLIIISIVSISWVHNNIRKEGG